MHVQGQGICRIEGMLVCAAWQQAQISRTNTESWETYSCGNRIREASCSDAYCFINTGKRVDLALMQLIDAGGYFRIPRPIGRDPHSRLREAIAMTHRKKFMVCRYIKI